MSLNNGQIFLIAMSNLFNQLFQKSFIIFSGYFAIGFNLSYSEFSWLVVLQFFGSAFAVLISGNRLFNKLNVNQSIFYTQTANAFFAMIQCFSYIRSSFILLIIINFFVGITTNIPFTNSNAIIGALSKNDFQKQWGITLFNTAWGIATLFMPIVGMIFVRLGFEYYFIIFASLIFAIGVILFIVLPSVSLIDPHMAATQRLMQSQSQFDKAIAYGDRQYELFDNKTRVTFFCFILFIFYSFFFLKTVCFSMFLFCAISRFFGCFFCTQSFLFCSGFLTM